jgi:hypothetical protein
VGRGSGRANPWGPTDRDRNPFEPVQGPSGWAVNGAMPGGRGRYFGPPAPWSKRRTSHGEVPSGGAVPRSSAGDPPGVREVRSGPPSAPRARVGAWADADPCGIR